MPKNRRNYQKTRHIALSGLLFALAMALSFIEGTLVIPGLLPGMTQLGRPSSVTTQSMAPPFPPGEGLGAAASLSFKPKGLNDFTAAPTHGPAGS